MAAFKFRLDALLRVREHAKDEKRWELRALNEARRQMENDILALEQELGAADGTLTRQVEQIFSAIDLKLIGEHCERITQRIQVKRTELAALDDQLTAKRAELVEAMRAVKTLEQLRKRQAEKFRREQDLKEQKFIDEVAQRKFVGAEGRQKIPG